jgi:hypothetical protein
MVMAMTYALAILGGYLAGWLIAYLKWGRV